MRRALRLGTLLLTASLLLAGCGTVPPPVTETPTPTATVSPPPQPTEAPGTAGFVLPCYGEESFHPLTGTNRANLNLAGLIYEGLFALDARFAPEGLLSVEERVSEDGLTWTFTLRAGVTFSDGSPLTAGHVVSSLQTAMAAPSPYAVRLEGVRSVRAAEENQVTVTLAAPNGNLPALLDIPIVQEGAEGPLGTGPYRMHTDGETLSLVPNPGWWQGKALPTEEISLYRVKSADTLIHAFDTREISLVAADLTGTNVLGFSGNYEVWDYPTSVMLYVGYNAKTGPCADAAVRKALSYGFDRAACAKRLLSGHARAAALPFSPVWADYDSALADTLDYSPAKVDALLTAALWPMEDGARRKGGTALALTMIVNTDNPYKVALAEYLAGDLSKAGVAVELKKLTWEEYSAALAAGAFDLYLGEVKLTANFDLTPLLAAEGPLNYGGYQDEESETLLAAYLAADDTTRGAAASNLARQLSEGAPFTPLCFKNWSVLTHWGKVAGVRATQQNMFYRFSDWKTR